MVNKIKIKLSSDTVLVFLSVLFFYGIFYVWIEDILQAEAYHFHIRIIGYTIVFGLLFYVVVRKVFRKHFKNVPDRKILLLISTSLILAYGVQFMINKRIEKEVHEKKIFLNPLYDKYEVIAKQYNLDLTFTQHTKEQRGPVNYKINAIYAEKEKSIDVLFLGDSSIAWGLIPEVVEQISGKKVAVFAYESNVMTRKTAILFNMISKYYLKENGVLLISFDNHFYSKNPDLTLISKKEYEEMASWSFEEFSKFAKSKEAKVGKPTIKAGENKSQLNKENNKSVNLDNELSLFQSYQNRYNMFSKYLADTFFMRLKSVDFYTLYLEESFNLQWNKKKNVNIKSDTTMYLRWNMNSITLYDPNFDHHSIHSENMPVEKLADKNIEINAESAALIYGRKKIFMVPVFDAQKDYILSRNIYYTYYKKHGFDLCDLGLLHPKDVVYPMQEGSHMGNEGGLLKSILIGKYLKEL